ncbi:MAG TPA: hypothetical protein VJN93_12190 [Candidatus Acidoferrum sp.]|nr:hypothetical protein [Candidatus Acidoferrum sp.]
MTTKTPYDPNHPKINRVEVYWHTVTYKTVIIYTLLIGVIICSALYLLNPNLYIAAYDKFVKSMGSDASAAPISQTQARFVNLDGRVQVKKVNSVNWVDADYHTNLDKGDQIQTSTDGAARITFADGTTYTVKSGTFITVEENSMGNERPSSSGVRITTGQVDLRTPNWSSPDSRAAVSVEDTNTTASVRSNSHADVRADPEHKNDEIVVSSGSAEVQRGQEKVEIGQYQKAVFSSTGPITKSDVLAPPDLVAPPNFAPMIVESPKAATIHFEWKPVDQAVSYTLRISATAMFTKTLKEVPSTGNSAEVTGLDAGDYFWTVTATDAKKQTSEVSETFHFTLVAQGKTQQMVLEITGTELHGRVLELTGKTEPGAAIMVNGQPVPIIAGDGTFHYFTQPLEPGQHTIVIIGQNRRGGTAQQSLTIVVPK